LLQPYCNQSSVNQWRNLDMMAKDILHKLLKIRGFGYSRISRRRQSFALRRQRSQVRILSGAPFLLHFHPSDYLSASAPRSKFLRSGTPVSSYRFHRFSERDFSRARQLLGSRKRRGSNGLPAVERSIVPVAAEQLAAQKVKHLSVAPLSKRTTC